MRFLLSTHPWRLRLYILKQVKNTPKEAVTSSMEVSSETAILMRTASKGNLSELVEAPCLTK